MGKQWLTLFFLAPKSLKMVTAVLKLKDAYSLEGKFMTNLDIILKSRDITLPTKVCLVKAMGFLVVVYGYKSWTIKKAESHYKELWCWRRLLRVPWTSRRSNQSILKDISPGLIFIGRTDTEAETPVFCSSDVNSWLIGKVPDVGKD